MDALLTQHDDPEESGLSRLLTQNSLHSEEPAGVEEEIERVGEVDAKHYDWKSCGGCLFGFF